jgi:hypothetical protein
MFDAPTAASVWITSLDPNAPDGLERKKQELCSYKRETRLRLVNDCVPSHQVCNKFNFIDT